MPTRIAEVARPGDLVLTMGIGTVYLLCPEILAEIAAGGTRTSDDRGAPSFSAGRPAGSRLAPRRRGNGDGRAGGVSWILLGAVVAVLAAALWAGRVQSAARRAARSACAGPCTTLTRAEVERAAAGTPGRPLRAARHRRDRASGRRRCPKSRRSTSRRPIPSTVVITVTERVAVGYVTGGSDVRLVDRTGRQFHTVATAPRGCRSSRSPTVRGRRPARRRPPPRRARCRRRFSRCWPRSRPTIRRESHSCSVTIGSCGGVARIAAPTRPHPCRPAGPARDRLRRQRPRPSTPVNRPADRSTSPLRRGFRVGVAYARLS